MKGLHRRIGVLGIVAVAADAVLVGVWVFIALVVSAVARDVLVEWLW